VSGVRLGSESNPPPNALLVNNIRMENGVELLKQFGSVASDLNLFDHPLWRKSQYKPLAVNGDKSSLPAKPIDHVPLLEVFGPERLTKESDDIGSTLTVQAVKEHEPVRDPIASPKRIVPVFLSNTPPISIEWQGYFPHTPVEHERDEKKHNDYAKSCEECSWLDASCSQGSSS
jgi:hypothetical protein